MTGESEKISKAKLGVPRNDMIGKSYFGADEDTVRLGIEKMRIKTATTQPAKHQLFDERIVSKIFGISVGLALRNAYNPTTSIVPHPANLPPCAYNTSHLS